MNLLSIISLLPHISPPPFLFHHFSFINNALATSRRTRHQFKRSFSQVDPCYFCGSAQDSIVHIFADCSVVSIARGVFFRRVALPPPPVAFPLQRSFLVDAPAAEVIPVLAFNLAVWKFRLPAAASRLVSSASWLLNKLVDLASTLHSSIKVKKKRKLPLPPFPEVVDLSAVNHDSLVRQVAPDVVVAYTDGSALVNPGHCGAGVSIFLQGPDLVLDFGEALGPGTNNVAELWALGVCLTEIAKLKSLSPSINKALVFCDSQYALQAASSTKKPLSNCKLVLLLRKTYASSTSLLPIHLHWIRGHCAVGGNERVDRISKAFSRISTDNSTPALHLNPSSFSSSNISSLWLPGFPLTSLPLHCFTAVPSFSPRPPVLPVAAPHAFVEAVAAPPRLRKRPRPSGTISPPARRSCRLAVL